MKLFWGAWLFVSVAAAAPVKVSSGLLEGTSEE